MVIFDAAMLAGLRKTQEDHMQDTCVIYRVTERAKNSRGETVKTLDSGVESICGMQMDPSAFTDKGSSAQDNYIMTEIDAVIRLPHGTEVKPGDEVEITKRYGEDIIPQRYEVYRATNVGPSGNRAYLKVRGVK